MISLKIALRVVGVGIAIAIMAVLVSRIGAAEIFAQLAAVGPGFIWILVLHGAAIAIAAMPWYVLLPRDTRPTVGGAIASRFMASGANAVLPLFGLAGEVVRLLWLRKGERAPGVAAIVVDRLMHGAAGATLLAAGLVGLLHVPALPVEYTRAATIGIVALLAVIAVGVVLASRFRMAERIHRLVRRLRKRVDHESQFGEDCDEHIMTMLRVRSRGPWVAWLLHTLSRAVIGAELYVGFWLLGVSLSWDEALVFAALPVILALAGAVVPSQLGVHEGAQAIVAASFGISPATAVAVVLLMRLRQLAGAAVIGLVLLLRRGPVLPAPAMDAEAAPGH